MPCFSLPVCSPYTPPPAQNGLDHRRLIQLPPPAIDIPASNDSQRILEGDRAFHDTATNVRGPQSHRAVTKQTDRPRPRPDTQPSRTGGVRVKGRALLDRASDAEGALEAGGDGPQPMIAVGSRPAPERRVSRARWPAQTSVAPCPGFLHVCSGARRVGWAPPEQRAAPTGAQRESAGRPVLWLRRAPQRARRARLEAVQKVVGHRPVSQCR